MARARELEQTRCLPRSAARFDRSAAIHSLDAEDAARLWQATEDLLGGVLPL
jgi:hypothetical protein